MDFRINKIMKKFEEDFFPSFFEDNPQVLQIDFFGSYMKGTEHEESDIDMILIPSLAWREEMKKDDESWLDAVAGVFQDIRDGLLEDVAIDVKLQEAQNENGEYGWTHHSDESFATFYSFGKGEVGVLGTMTRDGKIAFSER